MPFYVLMNSIYRTGGTQEILARKLAPQTGYHNVNVLKATINFVTSVRPRGTTPTPAGRLFVTFYMGL
jgi:hypothetical protein